MFHKVVIYLSISGVLNAELERNCFRAN